MSIVLPQAAIFLIFGHVDADTSIAYTATDILLAFCDKIFGFMLISLIYGRSIAACLRHRAKFITAPHLMVSPHANADAPAADGIAS